MLSRCRLALAGAAVACALVIAPAAAGPLASADAASAAPCVIYCIPAASAPLSFTHVAASAHCSITVAYEVNAKTVGRVHLVLKGTSRGDRRIHKTADPLAPSGSHTYKFKKLLAGSYKLKGWYESDTGAAVSASLALHCR
jgi:hypothetical protein